MTLAEAVVVLTARRHLDAEWCIAWNAIGPHAFGLARRGLIRVNLPADDAIRLAMEPERCDPPPSPSS